MKHTFIMVAALLATGQMAAQTTMEEALSAIERNNTTLKALRSAADAEKEANKTEIYLSDPEVGFNYLWGNPSAIGHREDNTVEQSFDLATLSGAKSRVAKGKNQLVEWQYRADRMDVLLEAKQCLLDVAYYDGLLQELAVRKSHAEEISKAQQRRLEAGDGNQMEYNNVKLALGQVLAEIKRVETERAAVMTQLAQLNGGQPLQLGQLAFPVVSMPGDFSSWYTEAAAKSPVLAYVKQDIEVSRKQLSLSKTMGLPSISVGYMSEKTLGERYQGVSVGMSLPLWSNRHKVRQAKAAVEAAKARETDATVRFYGQLQALYQRAVGLRGVADAYRQAVQGADNTQLLKKALDAGAISVIDYTVGAGLYYDAMEKALDAERDCQKALAELKAVEL